MPTNNRVFYAVEQLGFAALGETTYTALRGLQSIGIETQFNLEQIFQIGSISIYENIEGVPAISLTTEKVLDGYVPAYLLATKGATSPSLAGRSNVRCSAGFSIFSDVQDAASGTPLSQCVMSGLYVSSVNYNISVDGNGTESLTLVGEDKTWTQNFAITAFTTDESPLAISGSGGVQRREDVLLGESDISTVSILPGDIPGVTASGTVPFSGGEYGASLQSIRVATNLGREELFQLGSRRSFHKYASFPTQVTCDIDVAAQDAGDEVEAVAEAEDNLTDHQIIIRFREGLELDLGTKNKLSSVSMGGANAGQNGGNLTMTYSYINFNDLTVTHPQDPSGL